MSSGTDDKKARKRTTNQTATTTPSKVEGRKPRQQNQNNNNNHHRNSISKDEMSKYVLWRRPFHTLYYFLLELVDIFVYYFFKLLTYRKLVLTGLLLATLVVVGFNVEGSHLPLLYRWRKLFIWYMYWVGLGVASSIGLGTGLHTFLLYLGPFIAQVTLAAYECDSLEFPEPPYPDEIVCPVNGTTDGNSETTTVSLLSIMTKVRWESIMWGAGTAIGELPPYFMARASAMSTRDHKPISYDDVGGVEDDENLEEFEHLLELERSGKVKLNVLDRMRLAVFKIIQKVGFAGILLCASIPNPLFDLAGITCGHFMVPFSTFFGATLLGKAIVKMHIQQLFVIFLFSQHHLDNLFELLANVPIVGSKAQPLFQEWLTAEKAKLHSSSRSHQHQSSESILSWLLGKFVLLMILFFVVSIVNSLAQRRVKRLSYQHNLPSSVGEKKVAND